MPATDTEAPSESELSELTISEAAERYDIPRRSLSRAVDRGKVPARKIGNLHVIDPEAARLYGDVYRARRAFDDYTGRTDEDDDE